MNNDGRIMKNILNQVRIYVAVFVIALSILPGGIFTQRVAAQSAVCDPNFYSGNTILFFNACAQPCPATGGSTIGSVTKLRGDNNAEKIYNFWLDAGFSAQQAAGITGSMKHEGGFSPFRQEVGKPWESGGWGIAQFTFDPGQRGEVKAFLIDYLGGELFNEYYKPDYGGAVVESKGFIPNGVPLEVNDKFLLGELSYLLDHIQKLMPNNVRRDGLSTDFGQNISSGITLANYLKGLSDEGDAAIAWTYLYEYPGDIKSTSIVRASSASEILKLYANGLSTECGGELAPGGMTLEEGIAFMEKYKNSPDSIDYIGGAGRGCVGGALINCVSFSVYFINKYTTIEGFAGGAPGNGSTVAPNVIARNPSIKSGTTPRPYAIFSTQSGRMMCGNVKCGHTGIILGVDTDRGKVIVGEAICGRSAEQTIAREYDLSKFDDPAYIYAYTDGLLKGDIE